MSLYELYELMERLRAANEARERSDYVPDHIFEELPHAPSLQEALNCYFSQISTSNGSLRPAESWHIRTTPLKDSDKALRLAALRWFFEPSDGTISEFLAELRSVVDDAAVFEVRVHPRVWYGCDWQDFAFDGGNERWLLHLGFSD